jgi:hypothetical protein
VRASDRWQLSGGEEARFAPDDGGAAEIRSRGFLPLRPRTEARHHARPAFCGTAVVLGKTTYEVLSESEPDRAGQVGYRLRPWPEGEVVRDRVVYGLSFVRRVLAERERSRLRERVRPLRWLLYPLVGLLPEEEQERACERLGLYAVTATLVSGLTESAAVLLALALWLRSSESAGAILLLTSLPGLVLFALPGLGRAFAAALLRETGGSAPVALAYGALRGLGALRERHGSGFVPLTRRDFWERLARADTVQRASDGSLVYRGLLAHLTWTGSHRLQAGDDFWSVSVLPPELDCGRLLYAYRLAPLGEEGPDGPQRPAATAYADEVLGGVRVEWDSWNRGFSWLTTLLGAEVQERAFVHRGGPAAARGAVILSAGATALLGCYGLSFLPGGPAADPLAPFVLVVGLVLVADGLQRWAAARAERYAPSLLRFLLPADLLRPERVAYRAHREAERAALRQTAGA